MPYEVVMDVLWTLHKEFYVCIKVFIVFLSIFCIHIQLNWYIENISIPFIRGFVLSLFLWCRSTFVGFGGLKTWAAPLRPEAALCCHNVKDAARPLCFPLLSLAAVTDVAGGILFSVCPPASREGQFSFRSPCPFTTMLSGDALHKQAKQSLESHKQIPRVRRF